MTIPIGVAMDHLIRTAVQSVSGLSRTPEEIRAAEDHAIGCVREALTPTGILDLIGELAARLGGTDVSVCLADPHDVASIVAMGGEQRTTIFAPGEIRPGATAIEAARLRRGIVEIRAQRRARPPTPDELAALLENGKTKTTLAVTLPGGHPLGEGISAGVLPVAALKEGA